MEFLSISIGCEGITTDAIQIYISLRICFCYKSIEPSPRLLHNVDMHGGRDFEGGATHRVREMGCDQTTSFAHECRHHICHLASQWVPNTTKIGLTYQQKSAKVLDLGLRRIQLMASLGEMPLTRCLPGVIGSDNNPVLALVGDSALLIRRMLRIMLATIC